MRVEGDSIAAGPRYVGTVTGVMNTPAERVEPVREWPDIGDATRLFVRITLSRALNRNRIDRPDHYA